VKDNRDPEAIAHCLLNNRLKQETLSQAYDRLYDGAGDRMPPIFFGQETPPSDHPQMTYTPGGKYPTILPR
jgi:hypothetical protein